MSDFEGKMKGTGDMQNFGEGTAKRDITTGKGRPDLISPFALERLGKWLELGAEKYESRNWEKGMPYSRVTASMVRHTLEWMKGDCSEDNLAAIMCNAMFLMHYQSINGFDEKFNDMPKYDASEE